MFYGFVLPSIAGRAPSGPPVPLPSPAPGPAAAQQSALAH
jgi:hypothetical protein